MALSIQLTALRDMLQAETGQAVFIGRPENHVMGLYLWPWKLDVQANLRTMSPVPQREFLKAKKPELPLRIRVLVLPMAASGIESCDALAAALRAINDHPVLVAADMRGQVRIDAMPAEELAALFTAAELPLTLCLACTLEITAS
ncbi:MAG: hypothetical protein Q8L77_10205 [Nitrospirota bacterium]|nr:hypothetical protein [Nitrospirota bacterium]